MCSTSGGSGYEDASVQFEGVYVLASFVLANYGVFGCLSTLTHLRQREHLKRVIMKQAGRNVIQASDLDCFKRNKIGFKGPRRGWFWFHVHNLYADTFQWASETPIPRKLSHHVRPRPNFVKTSLKSSAISKVQRVVHKVVETVENWYNFYIITQQSAALMLGGGIWCCHVAALASVRLDQEALDGILTAYSALSFAVLVVVTRVAIAIAMKDPYNRYDRVNELKRYMLETHGLGGIGGKSDGGASKAEARSSKGAERASVRSKAVVSSKLGASINRMNSTKWANAIGGGDDQNTIGAGVGGAGGGGGSSGLFSGGAGNSGMVVAVRGRESAQEGTETITRDLMAVGAGGYSGYPRRPSSSMEGESQEDRGRIGGGGSHNIESTRDERDCTNASDMERAFRAQLHPQQSSPSPHPDRPPSASRASYNMESVHEEHEGGTLGGDGDNDEQSVAAGGRAVGAGSSVRNLGGGGGGGGGGDGGSRNLSKAAKRAPSWKNVSASTRNMRFFYSHMGVRSKKLLRREAYFGRLNHIIGAGIFMGVGLCIAHYMEHAHMTDAIGNARMTSTVSDIICTLCLASAVCSIVLWIAFRGAIWKDGAYGTPQASLTVGGLFTGYHYLSAWAYTEYEIYRPCPASSSSSSDNNVHEHSRIFMLFFFFVLLSCIALFMQTAQLDELKLTTRFSEKAFQSPANANDSSAAAKSKLFKSSAGNVVSRGSSAHDVGNGGGGATGGGGNNAAAARRGGAADSAVGGAHGRGRGSAGGGPVSPGTSGHTLTRTRSSDWEMEQDDGFLDSGSRVATEQRSLSATPPTRNYLNSNNNGGSSRVEGADDDGISALLRNDSASNRNSTNNSNYLNDNSITSSSYLVGSTTMNGTLPSTRASATITTTRGSMKRALTDTSINGEERGRRCMSDTHAQPLITIKSAANNHSGRHWKVSAAAAGDSTPPRGGGSGPVGQQHHQQQQQQQQQLAGGFRLAQTHRGTFSSTFTSVSARLARTSGSLVVGGGHRDASGQVHGPGGDNHMEVSAGAPAAAVGVASVSASVSLEGGKKPSQSGFMGAGSPFSRNKVVPAIVKAHGGGDGGGGGGGGRNCRTESNGADHYCDDSPRERDHALMTEELSLNGACVPARMVSDSDERVSTGRRGSGESVRSGDSGNSNGDSGNSSGGRGSNDGSSGSCKGSSHSTTVSGSAFSNASGSGDGSAGENDARHGRRRSGSSGGSDGDGSSGAGGGSSSGASGGADNITIHPNIRTFARSQDSNEFDCPTYIIREGSSSSVDSGDKIDEVM